MKPKKFYFIIAVLFILVILAAITAEVYSYQRILGVQSNIAEQEYRIAKIDERTDILSSLSKRYKSVEENLAVLNTALPDKKDSSKLLSDLDTLAQESGLKLTLLASSTAANGKKPTAADDPSLLQTTKGKNSIELPLDIKAEGSFINFESFIKKIENYQRLVNINSVEISQPAEKRGTDFIEAKLKVTAYLKK
jgi:Tfp pilus assembly protein PilO